MNKLILELLLQIHLYYPIGLPNSANSYSGTKLIQDKVVEKLEQLDNTNTPWFKFSKDIESKVGKSIFFDYSFNQFPSYSCKIQLEKTSNIDFDISKNIVIELSLLTKHYTIFFNDEYKNKRYQLDSTGSNNSIKNEIWYYKSCKIESEFKLADSFKLVVKNYFPDYNFIEHDILFNCIVEGGLPFNRNYDEVMPNQKFSVYEYLFDNNIMRDKIEVLK
jgi:hypothetical protein